VLRTPTSFFIGTHRWRFSAKSQKDCGRMSRAPSSAWFANPADSADGPTGSFGRSRPNDGESK
jgi:hypothetical protein